MGEVLPFKRHQIPANHDSQREDEAFDAHDRAGVTLHRVFDQLAKLESFAIGLPKEKLVLAAHHAVDLQDEVHLLADFREDTTSEEAQRLAEMAAQLEIVPLADYISGLTAFDAHRTPQRVMAYTSDYIERIPHL